MRGHPADHRLTSAATGDTVEESRALTGLRALAAILVMLHHFTLKLGLDQHLPFVQWVLRKGYLGVDLFFVLSGFVLSMVYGSWFDGRAPWSAAAYARFVGRRVARLWPLHATILLLILLSGLQSGPHAATPRMMLANLAMVQAWGLSAALNPPAWSVSTEFFSYLVFPPLALLVLPRRWGAWLCAAAIVGLLALSMQYAAPLGSGRRGWLDLYQNYSAVPLLRCLAGFMLGMLAWRTTRLDAVRRLSGTGWFGPAMLVAFIVLLMGRVNDLVILPLLPLVVLGFHFGRGPVHRALAANPLHGLGLISYATYLLHYPLLGLFPFHWIRLSIMLPLYLAVTIGLAAVMHGLVEQPGRRLVRSWTDRAIRFLLPRPPAPCRAARPPLQDAPP